MDNDPVMFRCCVEVIVITIGFAVGWFVYDWIRGAIEYRREMGKMKGREE